MTTEILKIGDVVWIPSQNCGGRVVDIEIDPDNYPIVVDMPYSENLKRFSLDQLKATKRATLETLAIGQRVVHDSRILETGFVSMIYNDGVRHPILVKFATRSVFDETEKLFVIVD